MDGEKSKQKTRDARFVQFLYIFIIYVVHLHVYLENMYYKDINTKWNVMVFVFFCLYSLVFAREKVPKKAAKRSILQGMLD